MATACIAQVAFRFEAKGKPVVAAFDIPDASSDGGLVLLEVIAIAHGLAGIVIEHHRRRLKGRATRITIDLDPTDDPTHGQQEFTFFNGHYDTWCYLPVVATVTFNEETEQFAVAAVLRPGNAPAHRGARGLLRRLLRQLRAAFPQARFRVRLDGGFASPPLFTFLEREQVEYLVAMPSNARLEKRARRLMGQARVLSRASGRTAHRYRTARHPAPPPAPFVPTPRSRRCANACSSSPCGSNARCAALSCTCR